ncbi:MAG TPA: hypothetical protein VF599_12395 [Pyrinomonadaceae bacterium]|jgi:hypothetical protein
MAFNTQRLKKAYYAFSSIFKRQPAFGTSLADADLDSRHNCTVTFEDVVERDTIYDCGEEDVFDEETTAQLKRIRLSYASITPQRLFGWICMLLSAVAAPTGTPANKVVTVTINATGGTFTITVTLEGLTFTTSALAWNASAATVQSALEACDWLAGNITVGLATLVYTLTFVNDLAKTNLPVVTTTPGALTGGTSTAAVAVTTPGANKFHAATRSTDDALAKTSIGCGYEGNTVDPEKFYNCVVESIVITLNRRKVVTVEVVLLGRFTPSDMDSFDVPDCENLPALKGAECLVKVDGEFLREEFWNATITLNNQVPTGDDAFPFSGTEVATLERGDKPTYPISMQVLGSEGDAVHTLCKDGTKAPIEFLLGLPGNRASLIFPNVLLKFASNPKVYVGELRRSAIAIDANPHKDATLGTPLKAEGYLDQTSAFLTT